MSQPVPCKVCASIPDVVGTPVQHCDVLDYFVRCSNDDCGYCPLIVDKERAIAIWNDNNSTEPIPVSLTARECAKKIHDRLTWYPNDNTVDVIATIITRHLAATTSPSETAVGGEAFIRKVAALPCARVDGDECAFFEKGITNYCASCHARELLVAPVSPAVDDEGEN